MNYHRPQSRNRSFAYSAVCAFGLCFLFNLFAEPVARGQNQLAIDPRFPAQSPSQSHPTDSRFSSQSPRANQLVQPAGMAGIQQFQNQQFQNQQFQNQQFQNQQSQNQQLQNQQNAHRPGTQMNAHPMPNQRSLVSPFSADLQQRLSQRQTLHHGTLPHGALPREALPHGASIQQLATGPFGKLANDSQSEPSARNNGSDPPRIANRFTNPTLNPTIGRNSKPIPAAEPKLGEHFYPQTDHPSAQGTFDATFSPTDFNPDPGGYIPFDPWSEADVYDGKYLNANQRPLLELGKPFYQLGQLPVSKTFLGRTNLIHPRFQIFGDFRTAVGFNAQDGDYRGVWGALLNLEMDLRITATERFHARVAPLDRAGQVTRVEYDDRQTRFFNNTDFEFDTGFFEGDLGALFGGMFNEVLPFDLPITAGAIPLLYQNGIWMDDAFIGMAAALPARNSPFLDISNYDLVFFWGFDNITSPAFQGDDNAAKMYGVQLFAEMLNGYVEGGYAFLEDRTALDRSYHNIGLAYTRRYGRFVSNSVRVLANAGQNPNLPGKTADGVLVLLENSFITQHPNTVIPYFNFFAGFGTPQSVARAGGVGGVLKNTGINFETDGVTNFPTLDDTANDTWGAALGLNLLSPEFTQQVILETAFLDVMGNDPLRNSRGRQLGLGVRYQLPISNAVIFRADAMHGFRENDTDLSGFRAEIRHKF